MATLPAKKHESDIAGAVSRITPAKTVAVVLPEFPSHDLAAAAAALVIALRKAGKIITAFAPPTLALDTSSLADVFADGEPLRELIISFDVTKSPVRELRYERDAERLDILLSPLSSPLRREDIVFRHGSLRYDLAITIGVPRPEAALANLERAPELLHEKPIVNVDINLENTSYGEINIVLPEASFAELIARLLEALGIAFDNPPVASLLLTSLAAATKHLALAEMTAERFLLAGALLAAGATLPEQSVFAPPGPIEAALVHLSGRALARIRFINEGRGALLYIRHEDFVATATTLTHVTEALHIAEGALPGVSWVALAAETNDADRSVQIAFHSLDVRLTSRLAESDNFHSDENGVLLSQRAFQTSDAALTYINELLLKAHRVE